MVCGSEQSDAIERFRFVGRADAGLDYWEGE
jgi:hypothetical protein